MEVRILRNDHGRPARKLAGEETPLIAGELAGLKLVGFTVREEREGKRRRAAFPGRTLVVHGDEHNFELLRAVGNSTVLDRVRDLVLSAYERQSTHVQQAVSQ